MRTITTALSVALLFTLGPILQAQYQVGPVYPERQNTYWSAGTNYDPFRLNWASGRFDYVPIPYATEPAGSNYDPYRFNEYTSRWDYVPLASVQSFDLQTPVAGSGPSPTVTMPPASAPVETPQPDFNTGQGTELFLRPVEPDWLVRAAERSPAPTTAPVKTQHPEEDNGHAAPTPSLAPTTRPTAPASPIVVAN